MKQTCCLKRCINDFSRLIPSVENFTMHLSRITALILGTVTLGLGQIDEERSYLLLQSTRARARVKLGETLVYKFCIVLNITNTDIDTMSVYVNGSNLLVQDTSDLQETNFTWVNMNGQTVRDVETPTYEVETFKETSLLPSSELDMIFPVTVGTLRLQNVSGTLRLHVPENAELGTILRPVMYISFLDRKKLLYETFIFGDYAFVHLPDLIVNQEQPHFLGRKQRSKITSQLVVTAGTLGPSFLNIYMPKNFTLATDDISLNNGEPFLTVKDFQVVGYTGVMDETIAIITKMTPVFLSNTRSSEIDQLLYSLPDLEPTANTSTEVDFMTEVECLDFLNAENGSEMRVTYILDFSNQFFVVRKKYLYLNISSKTDNAPKLDFTLDLIQSETESEREIANLQYQLRVWHQVSTSWSSAYDISVFLYLPAYLRDYQMVKSKDVVCSGGRPAITLSDHYVEMSMDRMSFVHNVKIVFNLTMDTSVIPGEIIQETDIVVELVYRCWRKEEDIRNISRFRNTLPQPIFRDDLSMPACGCSLTHFATCTCSAHNSCRGRIDNITCVSCDFPWHCVQTLPGYGVNTRLQISDDEAISCKAQTRNRKRLTTAACALLSTNSSRGLPPVVGTVLGVDTDSGVIYGISQNGLAYIISHDRGNKWYSVSKESVTVMATSQNFKFAVLA